MATSKSTVLGLRLDHSRRSWVEAEAGRRGVSVRVLFEGMIDDARTGETADGARAVAGLGSASGPATDDRRTDEGLGDTPDAGELPAAAPAEGVTTWSASSSAPSPWPGLGSRTAFPHRIVRGAVSITTGLIRSGGRFAHSRVERCPLTRLWSER